MDRVAFPFRADIDRRRRRWLAGPVSLARENKGPRESHDNGRRGPCTKAAIADVAGPFSGYIEAWA